VFGLRRRVRIAYEPIPWSAQGDPKIEQKKGHISEPPFLGKKRKHLKKELQKVSKRVTSKTGWRLLGGSWGTFGDPSRFLTQEVSPPRPQSAPRDPKMTPKVKK